VVGVTQAKEEDKSPPFFYGPFLLTFTDGSGRNNNNNNTRPIPEQNEPALIAL
jgi:hypothetical protein